MESEKKKHSFIIYEDWMKFALSLPNDDALDFIRAVFSHCLELEYNPGPVASAILNTVLPKLDADIAEYNEKCRKARESIEKRWDEYRKQKDTDVYERIPPNTDVKQTYTNVIHDNDYVDVDDNVDVDVNDNVLPTEGKRKEAYASKRETIDALVAKWNSYADRGSIPTIRSVSVDSKTGKSVLARVQEHGLDEVVEVMDMVFQSNYLRGMKNGWCAKFDWMFLPSNYEKIMNGNYADRDKVQIQNDIIDQWVADHKNNAAGW